MTREVALIGYSGHAFVVADILLSQGFLLKGYCEAAEKEINPYSIPYLGNEKQPEVLQQLSRCGYFIAIGDNRLRAKIFRQLTASLTMPVRALHAGAVISARANLGEGIMVGPQAVINPLASLGHGVICNSGAVIEHECTIHDFAHVGPGAVLTGMVEVGQYSFIGANAVVKPGIKIGENVVIGAGAVIVKDVMDNAIIIGNPQRNL